MSLPHGARLGHPVRVLVLLQNAWSYIYKSFEGTSGNVWHYYSWMTALDRSRSGQRLKKVVSFSDSHVVFTNTTPQIAHSPSTRLKPNLTYVRNTLFSVTPFVVLACGGQAERVARKVWPGHLLCIPHPVYRLVTNALLEKARVWLERAPFLREQVRPQRFALRQLRGRVEEEDLGPYAEPWKG